MLRRKPTRIELKPEDKEELEAIKKERAQQAAAELAAQNQGAGKQPLTPAYQEHPQPSTAARIGLLKCRFYNDTERALLTLKGQQNLVGGIGRGTELETDIDPIKARALLQSPDDLLGMKIGFVDEVCRKLGVEHLVGLGGFKNVRKDFSWEGFKLELDETQFEWGTVFEIEVETEEPEQLKGKLESFLHEHQVSYSYSSVTKFHNFINKTLQ
ncbi:hypothetical protein WJX73_002996 [Symbiochloris irregularis]|uniref:CYTH domain-containing protein n=1 Tax=Symbiochloris irregularis TaxID=706552 RepID=A0AAW1NWK3_9CHLO